MAENDIFARQGFGQVLGSLGHAALLIVDFVNGFDDADAFGGGNIHAAIGATATLLATARAAGMPTAFSRIVYSASAPPTVFQKKVPSLRGLVAGSAQIEIVPKLAPFAGEPVFDKQAPSMFFGTSLHQWLAAQRIDSLLVTGCTTSGCVRATVVDAMSLEYRCFVVESCVGDRSTDRARIEPVRHAAEIRRHLRAELGAATSHGRRDLILYAGCVARPEALTLDSTVAWQSRRENGYKADFEPAMLLYA